MCLCAVHCSDGPYHEASCCGEVRCPCECHSRCAVEACELNAYPNGERFCRRHADDSPIR